MMALSSAVEPLRSANRFSDDDFYDWKIVAARPGPVPCSNAMELTATHGIDDAPFADLTLVVASIGIEGYRDPAVLGYLRRLRADGLLVGAISTGTLILARAGLPEAARVTIHWEMRDFLEAEFPELDVTGDLFCRDGSTVTAAGGMAAMDMVLALIAEHKGVEAATGVARQFLHGPLRPSTDTQHDDVRWRYRITDDRVVAAVRLMERAMERPLRIADIATRVEVSERQLERLFAAAFGRSPSDFYMAMRVEAARGMLLHSTTSLDDISDATGFSSASHFSRTISERLGMSPSRIRRDRGDA